MLLFPRYGLGQFSVASFAMIQVLVTGQMYVMEYMNVVDTAGGYLSLQSQQFIHLKLVIIHTGKLGAVLMEFTNVVAFAGNQRILQY
jgi:hypothetical protein